MAEESDTEQPLSPHLEEWRLEPSPSQSSRPAKWLCLAAVLIMPALLWGCGSWRSGSTKKALDEERTEPATHQAPVLAATLALAPTPAPNPATTLYCIMVVQPPPSYEYEVAKYLFANHLSIFLCDGWDVFSDGLEDPLPLGLDANGEPKAETVPIPGPKAYWDKLYGGQKMMFNANVFYRAWEHVVSIAAYKNYAFTVKVDADAVFMPVRLREQLVKNNQGRLDEPDVPPGKNFMNCPHFVETGTLQGPLEVFSRAAIENFGVHKQICYDKGLDELPEDIGMRRCMEALGTWKLSLFMAVYDNRCPRDEMIWNATGKFWQSADCRVPGWTVYHPFKGLEEYTACYDRVKAQGLPI